MENRKIPVVGELYRHFKGNLYQIVGIAKHSETMEQLVVYQALYGEYGLYARPLEMFMSLVDKEKYPEVVQEYRFEKCMPMTSISSPTEQKKMQSSTEKTVCDAPVEVRTENSCGTGAENDEETVRPEILRFLDAEGADAKLKVLRELHMDLDESLLTTIELSLDLLPDDKASLECRYDFVERTLEQKIRFEGGRLR